MYMKDPHMMKYSGELGIMRRYMTDSKPYPQINMLVFSVSKDTSETVCQKYYKENRYPLLLHMNVYLQVLNQGTLVNIILRKPQRALKF
jgi:hypothetical protein